MKLSLLLLLFIPLVVFTQTTEDFMDLLGRDVNSTHVQLFINNQEITPEITKFDDVSYYEFKSLGYCFIISKFNVINHITFYSQGKSEYSEFKDMLPFNLKFDDTRKDIEKKLGAPNNSGGEGVIEYWSHWKNKKLHIVYKLKNPEDMFNTVGYISVSLF